MLFCLKNSFQTPLDDYVNTPDSNYKYDLIYTYEQAGYKLYILNMTSQRWQDGIQTFYFNCVFNL